MTDPASRRRRAFDSLENSESPIVSLRDRSVRTSGFGTALPLVVTPEWEQADLASWIKANAEWVDATLLRHGAMLFRGFDVDGAQRFREVACAISPDLLEYHEASSPRTSLGGGLYTSTDYPADQWIHMHNELSYSHAWPWRVLFFCSQPAANGGETPLADSREVYRRIPPAIRDRFNSLGVMYVRNYGPTLGLRWQQVFGTTDPGEVEGICRSSGIETEWLEGGRLRTKRVRPAATVHPRTSEMVWFNQANAFHVSVLGPGVTASLLAEMAHRELPRNVYYGDGTPIEAACIEEIQAAYRELSVSFPWQCGDVLLLDNLLVAHGRAPYSGERKILVALLDLHQGDE